MPYAINDEILKARNDDGSPNPKALQSFDRNHPPTKPIPHLEFPRCVYRYPKSPTKEIVEVRAGQEYRTIVPLMALSKLVNNEKELAAALKEGWRKEPYVPPFVQDPQIVADYE